MKPWMGFGLLGFEVFTTIVQKNGCRDTLMSTISAITGEIAWTQSSMCLLGVWFKISQSA